MKRTPSLSFSSPFFAAFSRRFDESRSCNTGFCGVDTLKLTTFAVYLDQSNQLMIFATSSSLVPSHLVIKTDGICSCTRLELIVAHKVFTVLIKKVKLAMNLLSGWINDSEIDIEFAAARDGELNSDELLLSDVHVEAFFGLWLDLQCDGLGGESRSDESEEESDESERAHGWSTKRTHQPKRLARK